jgi:hypothetical protein
MNYYDIGTKDNPVVSNSSLSSLNPEEGGSPRKFMSFFSEREEEKETTALNRGKLLHNYMENKDLFAISTVEKPSGDMGSFVSELYHNIQTYKTDSSLLPINIVDTVISSDAKKDTTKTAEVMEITAGYSDIANLLGISFDEAVKLIRYTRIKGEYYISYKEGTFIEKVKNNGLDYFNALKSLEGKTVLTKADKEALDGALNSLYTNSKIVSLLNLDDKPLNEATIRFIKEPPIQFTTDILVNDELIKVPCKIKPDVLRIHDDKKIILEIDYKTTGSLYGFGKSFEWYNYDRQHSFYNKGIKDMFPDYTIKHYNVVVETSGLFQSGIYQIGNSYMLEGSKKVDSLLNRFAWHKHSGIWHQSMEEYLGNGVMLLEKKEE